MPNNAKIVCFDIGGVLVKIRHTWNKAMESVGLPATEEQNVALGGFEQFLRYQEGLIEPDYYLLELGAHLGITPEEAGSVHAAILDVDYPGAIQLVEDLKAQGIFTCCFSNTNGLHWARLTSAEFHPAVAALDAKFASHDIGIAKPLLESFAEVESRMPEHSRVVFFDDTAENVHAAREAGWTSFQIDPLADPITQMRLTLQKVGVLE